MVGQEYILQVLREGLFLVLLISAPAVIASLVVGLAVSLFQAATQLQDHTLTFAPKLVAVLLVLVVSGPWIIAQLVNFTQTVLQNLVWLR